MARKLTIPKYTTSEDYDVHPHNGDEMWETEFTFEDGIRFKSYGRLKEISEEEIKRRYIGTKFEVGWEIIEQGYLESLKTLRQDTFEAFKKKYK